MSSVNNKTVAREAIGNPFDIRGFPLFLGFPYLVTRIVPGLYHITLIPKHLDANTAIQLGLDEVKMNRLPACVVLAEKACVYIQDDGRADESESPPRGGTVMFDHLVPGFLSYHDPSFDDRMCLLKDFVSGFNRDGYMLGDISKGGRPATPDELNDLNGFQEDGIPVGLSQCPICGDWSGECLDPNPNFEGLVMRVHCLCENNNRCAACGELLAERKLNGNHYDTADGEIWHWPGFIAFRHHCIKRM